MLKLCNHHIDKNTGVVRARPQKRGRARLATFFFENEDVAGYILSFFGRKGMKWGDNELRSASKRRLLDLAEEKMLLRPKFNASFNKSF